MKSQTCRTCDRALPLTEEFWYRNRHNKNGFSIHCKACDRAYYEKRKVNPDKRKEILQAINSANEKFGEFETEALKTKCETAAEGIISIYQEVL